MKESETEVVGEEGVLKLGDGLVNPGHPGIARIVPGPPKFMPRPLAVLSPAQLQSIPGMD